MICLLTADRLFNAGMLQREDPKRFYEYALRDRVTEPFAVFKYYYRTWGQLKALGVLPDSSLEVEECEDEPVTATGHGFEELDIKFLPSSEVPTEVPSPNTDKPLPALPVDRPESRCSIRVVDGPPANDERLNEEQDEAREDYEDESFYEDALDASPIRLKRLSFPPKTRFDPIQVQAPRSPIKTSRNASPAPTLSEYCDASSTVGSTEDKTADRVMETVESSRHTPSPVKRDGSRQESRELETVVPSTGSQRKATGGGFFKNSIRRVVGRHKRSRSS
ncbi:hypothetical protein HDK90DRAFT_9915 [Phyllosticta capitalensis]|uniref:Uncharacterized protein n=1 Tax=Phyllosticta capitalensis TaxID=121624 RepID=A0ABR1Z206_9PEZI